MKFPTCPTGGAVRRLGALCVLLAAASFGGDVPSKTYRNSVHKFSMDIFPEWNEVPIEVGEKYEVAKFYDPRSRGESFRPEITVYRLDKRQKNPEGPITGVDPSQLPEEIRKLLEAQTPKCVYDLAFGRLIVPDSVTLDANDFKKVTSKDKLDGKLWVHEIPRGGPKDKDATLLAILAAWERDGVEYGVFCTSSATRRKDFEMAMKSIAKSFLYFDAKAKEVASIDVLADVNISAKRRRDIERGMIKGWGVEVSPKKNYVVIYNTKRNKNKSLAKTIAERIEKIREQVYEVQFPPSEPVKAVSIVRVCGDRSEYHAYGGPGGSAGYWNSGTEELVFYDASPAQKVDEDTLAVLYHEAFHQYIYYSVGSVAPHSWFNEGHGDYYAGAKYESGKFRIKPFNWRVGLVKQSIRQGPRTRKIERDEKTGEERVAWGFDKGYTPLQDLVKFSQGQYYSYPGVSYAQGWSLIYFLREGVPKKREWNEKWGKILERYFTALKREVAKEGRLRRGGDKPDEPGPDDPPEPPAPKDPPPEPPAPKDPPADPKEPGDPPAPTDPDDPDGPDDPGDPGDGTPPAPVDPGFQPFQEGEASESALEIAVREAFAGVDFVEFEKAWAEFTLKVSG